VFGAFVGTTGDCVQTGVTTYAFFVDREGSLALHGDYFGWFRGPVAVAHCRFVAFGADPDPSDFTVSGDTYGLAAAERPARITLSFQCPASTATTTTLPAEVRAPCGAPLTLGSEPNATDALYILRAALGLEACDPCVCSVAGSADITVRDAFAVLSGAPPTSFACPACPDLGGSCELCSIATTGG
jgi:hypothetical protein